MTHSPFFARVATALIVVASTCSKVRGQEPLNIHWNVDAVAQVRTLFDLTKTEIAGCLYGQNVGDTIEVNFFITSTSDPRQASDSEIPQGTCPNIKTEAGNHMIGVLHTHMRPFSSCFPSGFGGKPTDPPIKDRGVLVLWMTFGAQFGAIMCARGDSIATYTLTAYGMMGVPSLDSLYRHP